MVYYGPWIQDPDYQRAAATVGMGGGWSNTSTGVSMSRDGQTQADPGDMTATLQDSANDGWGVAHPSAPGGDNGGLGVFTWQPSVIETGPRVEYTAGRSFIPAGFTAWDVNTFAPSGGPGAIGYEMENDNSLCAVVAASVTFTGMHYSLDTTTSSHPLVGGSWTTRLVSCPTDAGRFVTTMTGTNLETWNGQTDTVGATTLASYGPPAVGGTTTTETVDVTSSLTGGPSDGLLVLTVLLDVGSVNLADPTVYGGGEIGMTMSAPTITYTLRPPRYRWIYAQPPVFTTPPLRAIQRGSDGLGVTGGRRAFQNRSRQSSGRGLSFY